MDYRRRLPVEHNEAPTPDFVHARTEINLHRVQIRKPQKSFNQTKKMKRAQLITLARTIEKTIQGGVVAGVPLTEHVNRAILETRYYRPTQLKKICRSYEADGSTLPDFETQVVFTKRVIVDAIKSTAEEDPGVHVAALNFASYKKRGGGWMSGAVAQEESIARASALVSVLETRECDEFYETTKVRTRGFVDQELLRNGLIFSEAVPFFATPDGVLCKPYFCSVITAAAVNCNSREVKSALSPVQIAEIMDIRIKNVLAISINHGVTTLLLGAWGTGVFGNSVHTIAQLFHKHLNFTFPGCFEKVEFAIPDERTLVEFKSSYEAVNTVSD